MLHTYMPTMTTTVWVHIRMCTICQCCSAAAITLLLLHPVPFLQELVRCEREQCCSQLEAEEHHHRSLLEQKQQAKRAKRVALVQDTLERVLDLAVKMCHYKEETNG